MVKYYYSMETLKILGEVIRRRRKEMGLTQEELGNRAGVDPKYIGEIERGNANITIKTLFSISQALDTTPVELLSFSTTGIKNYEEFKIATRIMETTIQLSEKEKALLLKILKALIQILSGF